MVTLYLPGTTPGKVNCPAELVVVSLTSLVSVLVSWALASGTTAPPGSVTVPKTSAVLAVCAAAGIAERRSASDTPTMAIFDEAFMMPPTKSVDERGQAEISSTSLSNSQEERAVKKV